MSLKKEAFLVLEDGTRFRGHLSGGEINWNQDRGYGEVVFNTGMTGYQEILTDPSYFGQIICMTQPQIGNTGINFEDSESHRSWCSGLVILELSDDVFHWRKKENLESYLQKQGIPLLTGVDTRALTLHLRSKGATRGLICSLDQMDIVRDAFKALPPFEGRDLIREVTTEKPYQSGPDQAHALRVTALDFGIKKGLVTNLERRGCNVRVLPAYSSIDEILNDNREAPDGLFLSNGPGDPSVALPAITAVKALLGKLPIFGVCMGHQILCQALEGRTYKLKFGHRGSNQPVFDETTGRVEISSHNHGYAVDPMSLSANVRITHRHLNDKTVEGIEWIPGDGLAPAFSVQYHPEACPGPHDSEELFDRFIAKILGHKKRLNKNSIT
ncbi:MAG: glutamine-hydrolyzing carbamoyl-phosphate synthase small subunit [Bdellovibrionales bacterium]|nr:glutamine-hydrolyzing carbamoyl-phosphate synthase small subunit [Bdellovibrionales bacterium]